MDIVIRGQGLDSFGFVANDNIAGLGLNSFGFLWPCDIIWQNTYDDITTVWVACDDGVTGPEYCAD